MEAIYIILSLCSHKLQPGVFHQKLHDMLCTTKRGDVVIVAGDINGRVGWMSPKKTSERSFWS